MDNKDLILKSIVVGIVLNILVSSVFLLFDTTSEEEKRSNERKSSSLNSIISVCVVNKQVLFTVSVLNGLFVGLCVYLTCKFLK